MYGLAKVHKAGTPLRPILSLPGSMYEPLTKELAKLLDRVQGTQIECSTSSVKEGLADLDLEEDEVLISLDVESLFTNVPVHAIIQQAADDLYETDAEKPFTKPTFIKLMEMAVSDVYFMCEGVWYQQTNGVAMGSVLSVMLANLWLFKHEGFLGGDNHFLQEETGNTNATEQVFEESSQDPCGKCGKRVTKRGYSIQCIRCGYWYHRLCSGMSVSEIRQISEGTWRCGCRQSATPCGLSGARFFKRYVDDILRTIKRETRSLVCWRLRTRFIQT